MRSSIIILASAAIVSAQSAAPQPTVTATPGSLALGADCSDDAQCSGGAQCWASNSMLIRRCGNFNAGCTTNQQCAYNTCSNGLCNGIIAPSGNGTAAPYPTGGSLGPTGSIPGPSISTSTIRPTTSGSTPTGPTSTPSQPSFTGDASSKFGSLAGVAAIVFGVVAWVL